MGAILCIAGIVFWVINMVSSVAGTVKNCEKSKEASIDQRNRVLFNQRSMVKKLELENLMYEQERQYADLQQQMGAMNEYEQPQNMLQMEELQREVDENQRQMDENRMQMDQLNQMQMDMAMRQVIPFEQSGFDLTQGNSFNMMGNGFDGLEF
ncbi:MAG: hypothetical protein LKF52_07180 [Butyrivibrio sp.]|jgi:predicted RNase H-like nuclease (RuvC/YqgF family)|nr:hypothetical protein [Butyrivibrio sp.]